MYHACPYKYYLAVERGLSPLNRSTALDIGAIVHEGLKIYHHPINQGKTAESRLSMALDQMNQKISEIPGSHDDDWDPAFPAKLLTGYAHQYPEDDFKVLSVEQEVSFQLGDGIFFRGTIDMLARSASGDLFMVEHKTARTLSANLIKHYSRSPQTMGYAYCLSEVLKEPVAYVLFNFIIKSTAKKPTVAPYDRQKALLNTEYLRQWHDWALTAGKEIQSKTGTTDWRQNRYNCHPFAGRECSFIPICYYGENPQTLALFQQGSLGSGTDDLSGGSGV
jgi:RecB family exonuclease